MPMTTHVDDGEAGAETNPVPDKYALHDLPRIDCEARLSLCQARCCTLSFALSRQDVLEGLLRWDKRLPYRIARADNGYCVHNQRCVCEVYAQRPAPCRSYDCRQDPRIWIDFEQRIPMSWEGDGHAV